MNAYSQLGAQDAQFLYVQGGDVLTHVMAVSLYDPATAPGGKVRYREIVRHVASRCHASPVFVRKLHRVPFDFDHPYWVEDPAFDIEAHVAHVRLPQPGDWRQFCILAARHFARPMDMSRPLWDLCVVEGLDRLPGVAPGSYALLQRFHHAAIDGAAGAQALGALCDSDARGTAAVQPDTSIPPGIPPSPAATLVRALAANLASPARMLDATRRLAPGLMRAAARRMTSSPGKSAPGAPVTRFNHRVSPHRVFAATEITLRELRQLGRCVDGATVNDVILAIVGGAVRRYLLGHGDLPRRSLVALSPINVRSRKAQGPVTGNDLSLMTVALGTDIEDPVARLRAIRERTREAKAARAGLGARLLSDLTRQVPGVTLAAIARLAANERIARSQANLIVTNVPGPQQPLYMCGARLTHQYGMGPVTHGLGLFVSAHSYAGKVSLCITADRQLVPDIEALVRCVERSRAELASPRRPRAQGRRTPVRRSDKPQSRSAASRSTAQGRTPAKP